mgnify:CR=1 FL=1
MTMEPASHQESISSPHHNISKHINSKCNNSNKTWNVWVRTTRKGKEINLKRDLVNGSHCCLFIWNDEVWKNPITKKITYKIPTFGLKDHIHFHKRTWMHPYVCMPAHIHMYVLFGNSKLESSCIWFLGTFGLWNGRDQKHITTYDVRVINSPLSNLNFPSHLHVTNT